MITDRKAEAAVLFQDDELLVCFKPYGVFSEAGGKKPNMPDLLRTQTGRETLYTVHRLDRTTQGLMVYAKTAEAAKRLSELIRRDEIEKTYLAVVEGVPGEVCGTLCDLLYFDRQRNKSYIVERERRGVKKALLAYETLSTAAHEGRTLSLVRIRLQTGRTHQIRVQFASRKMPLVGDRRYGSAVPCQSIMLCSAALSFVHPFTGEAMRFTHEPENDYFGLFRDQRQAAGGSWLVISDQNINRHCEAL
ncbi:RluA family pseudouridine synthase [Ruminococcus sp.]|uniref:RluA family pseudouridine synthase n=1 Tax=Ruminococcus sp. TaxID=41978 RepID=UPI00388F08E0